MTAASLDNTGSINLTGSSANQALLDVTRQRGFGTAGVVSGIVDTVRRQRDRVRERADHHDRLAGSPLILNGNDAFVEDSTALGVEQRADRARFDIAGSLDLDDGASVSTTGALANDGHVHLDDFGGDGGSSLTVAGTLTNSGYAQHRQHRPFRRRPAPLRRNPSSTAGRSI